MSVVLQEMSVAVQGWWRSHAEAEARWAHRTAWIKAQPLSARVKNVLMNRCLWTAADALALSPEDWRGVRNLGKLSYRREIVPWLATLDPSRYVEGTTPPLDPARPKNYVRDEAIAIQVLQGETLRTVGRAYGLSMQRCREITYAYVRDCRAKQGLPPFVGKEHTLRYCRAHKTQFGIDEPVIIEEP